MFYTCGRGMFEELFMYGVGPSVANVTANGEEIKKKKKEIGVENNVILFYN